MICKIKPINLPPVFFEETEHVTKITDILNYASPLGIFGEWMEYIFLTTRVHEIFNYKEKKLKALFGE